MCPLACMIPVAFVSYARQAESEFRPGRGAWTFTTPSEPGNYQVYVTYELQHNCTDAEELFTEARAQSRNGRIGEFTVIGDEPAFRRGDCNDDDKVDLSDAICILGWLFLGGEAPSCAASANTNGDTRVDLSDAVALLGHLFLGGLPPVAPFPDCGRSNDPTDIEMQCLESSCP